MLSKLLPILFRVVDIFMPLQLCTIVMAILSILWSLSIPSPPPCQNQCIFVRGYRISVQPRVLSKFTGLLKVSSMEETNLEDVFHSSKNPAGNVPFTDGKKRSSFRKSNDNAGSHNQHIHAAHKYLETDDQDRDDGLSNEAIVEAAPTVTEVVDTGYTAYHR
jgi:hypothetical protein